MNAVTIAFHSSAQVEATALVRRLTSLGYPVREESCDASVTGLGLILLEAKGAVLLLVNDGLLHAETCQTGLLEAWRELHSHPHVHSLMASSQRSGPGDVSARVLTSLARVSDVIRYMNFWQAAYLSKRRQVGASHEPNVVAELATVRRISQEIGELLRLIREDAPTDVRTLEGADAETIARLIGDPPVREEQLVSEDDDLDLLLEASTDVSAQEFPTTPPTDDDAWQEESLLDEPQHLASAQLPSDHASEPVRDEALSGVQVQELGSDLRDTLASAKTITLTETLIAPNLEAEIEFPGDASSEQVDQNEGWAPTEPPRELLREDVGNESDVDENPELPAVSAMEVAPHDAGDFPEAGLEAPASRLEHSIDDTTEARVLAEAGDDIQQDDYSEEPADARVQVEMSRSRNLEIYLSYLQEGGRSEARSFAEQGLRDDPEDYRLRYALGVQLLGDSEDHRDLRERGTALLTALLPTDYAAAAHLCLGQLSQREHDYGSARRHLTSAYRANKRLDAELCYRIGALIMDEFEEDDRAAKRFLRRALRSSVDNLADTNFRLGSLELRAGRLRRATSYLKEAVRLDRNHPFAAYELAVALLERGRDHRAAAYFEQAVESNPELDTEANRDAFQPLPPLTESSHLREGLAGKFERFVQAREDDRQDPDADLELAPVEEGNTADAIATLEEEVAEPTPPARVLTVLITGASSGIGAATARAFAEAGHRLVLTGRRVDRLMDLEAELKREYNTDVRLLGFDVVDRDKAAKLLNSLEDEFSEIDVLINNAGKAKGLAPIHEGDFAHWDEMIDVNVRGLLYMTRLVAPGMVARGSGHIVNVCSTAGHEVYPNGAVYCATKHAVDAITRGTRLDLFKYGIRVSQISPAAVEETEFSAVRFDGDEERAASVYADFQPLRAADVAAGIKWLVDQPAHVNVQELVVLATQQANSTTINRSGRPVQQ